MWKPITLSAIVALGVVLIGRTLQRPGRDERRVSHVSQSEASYRSAHTQILILGAGFGGLTAALKLDQQFRDRDDVSILVVDRDNDLLFTPLLWTAANGRTSPNDVVVPIRNFQKGRQFHVLHAEVESIDLDQREVHTSAGIRPYDFLILALGGHTSIPDLPGLRSFALPFRTVADALQLRDHLIDAVEMAHQSDDLQERQAWLTFVIGGAGDTGVELAATIHDYLVAGLFREYPWLVQSPVRIVVAGRSERVIPTSKPATSRHVQHVLEQEGIEVLTGTSITGVTDAIVETNVGRIPARTLFWAAGITPPDLIRQLPVPHAPNGAIKVDDHLRIPGHSEVYVIGDSSWAYDSATGAPAPATAQAARQQGKYVGETIALEYAKRPTPSYRYSTLGRLALLSHFNGVAEIGPFMFEGIIAFIMWHLVYLLRNPSWTKRLRLLVDWALSSLLGREIGQLRLDTRQSLHQAAQTSRS
jgi:NADH dehydrogenase